MLLPILPFRDLGAKLLLDIYESDDENSDDQLCFLVSSPHHHTGLNFITFVILFPCIIHSWNE